MAETFTFDGDLTADKDKIRAYIYDKPKDGKALLSDQQILMALSQNDDNIDLARADCHEMLASLTTQEALEYQVDIGSSMQMDARQLPAYHLKMAKELRDKKREDDKGSNVSFIQIDNFAYEVDNFGQDRSKYR